MCHMSPVSFEACKIHPRSCLQPARLCTTVCTTMYIGVYAMASKYVFTYVCAIVVKVVFTDVNMPVYIFSQILEVN